MKPANAILSSYGTSVFEVMSLLAVEHGAINLGQGFPDEDGPADVIERAREALREGPNQYAPMMGVPELRQAVAAHAKRFHGIDADWRTEVLVTSGATQALLVSLMGLIEPGDEVVLIEPLFDTYLPVVRRAGGIPRLVRMRPPKWELPREELRRAFSPRTKLVLVNSPHNPAAKVFTPEELRFLAGLVEEFDAYAVCDEVYEHMVFDGRRHLPLMALPGMRERCVRIGSAGKTFSMTGWKVGYVTAAPKLLAAIAKAHQFFVFATAPHTQKAVAYGLAKEDAYFEGLTRSMQAKRDLFAGGLARAGFEILPTEGTYFLTIDVRSVGFNGDDVAFCRRITTEAGVAAVPVSAFYQEGDVDRFARFCFCKKDHVLDEAARRLARHFAKG